MFGERVGFDFEAMEVVADQRLHDKSSEPEERSIDERCDTEKDLKRRKG